MLNQKSISKAMLNKKNPQETWGNLNRHAVNNNTIWLCDEHYQMTEKMKTIPPSGM